MNTFIFVLGRFPFNTVHAITSRQAKCDTVYARVTNGSKEMVFKNANIERLYKFG